MNNPGKITYFKNLDGLRAVAAFSVIFFHIGRWFKYPDTGFYTVLKFIFSFGGDGGALGVTFFFILSGFLITYLMFKEEEKSDKVNVAFFYVRRMLRIWPLYYLTVIVGFLIYPLILKLNGIPYVENASWFLYSMFAVNFDHIYNSEPNTGILGVQWSVAIEEQFYLVWPLVFYFFSKRKFFPILLLIVIFSSELFFIKSKNWQTAYYHLFSNFRFLAFGGLLAYICYLKKERLISFFNKTNRGVNFMVYSICLLMILFQHTLSGIFFYYKYLYHILPFLFFGYVIVEQNFSDRSFFKISSFKTLSWLGKISYGLYLTHMIAIYIVLGIFPDNTGYILLKVLLSVLFTLIISYLSYQYFELFFLSLKDKFSIVHSRPEEGTKKKSSHSSTQQPSNAPEKNGNIVDGTV